MLVGALALAVGAAIYDLAVREVDLSQTATQSQYAIYAADTGAECALYWDSKCASAGYCTVSGGSVFATSSLSLSSPSAPPTSGVVCNTYDIAAFGTSPNPYAAPNGPPITNWSAWSISAPDASHATTTFTIHIPSGGVQNYCATVEVGKAGNPAITTVVSHGYNNCSNVGVTRLERKLQVTY